MGEGFSVGPISVLFVFEFVKTLMYVLFVAVVGRVDPGRKGHVLSVFHINSLFEYFFFFFNAFEMFLLTV